MAQKKLQYKSTKAAKFAGLKRTDIIGIIIVLICLSPFIFLGLLSVIPNPTLYSANKDSIKSKTQAVLDNVNLPGNVIYGRVRDKGCDDRGAGYFQTEYTCGFIAQKYVKASGDLKTDLVAADKALQVTGFKPDATNDEPLQGLRYNISQLDHSYGARLGYVTPSLPETYISPLISSGEIAAPTSNEYIYGVTFSVTYQSCSKTSLFQPFCPAAPEGLLIH